MATMIPDDVRFTAGLHGEATVWSALREQLPENAVVLHSTAVRQQGTEREVDLLVLWPGVGVIVVEVKGGWVEYRAGVWRNGRGRSEAQPIEDPADQVNDARHRLVEWLRDRGTAARRATQARWVSVVVLPAVDVPADWHRPGLPRECLVGRQDLDRLAERLAVAANLHGQGVRPLDDDDTHALVGAIVPELVPDEVQFQVADQAEEVRRLTAEQEDVLDAIREFPRARVIGGAGTGKTVLALRKARQLAHDGERVALMCYTVGLAKSFEREVATWPRKDRPAYVGTFHDLAHRWGGAEGDSKDQSYWEEALPESLRANAATLPREERFDVAVIDEAQDFGDSWWDAVTACLRDGDEGGLFVFLDDGQKLFTRHGRDPIDLPPVSLVRNLRSSKQIAQLAGAFATTPTSPKARARRPVLHLDVPAEAAVDAADDVVDALIADDGADGFTAGQIALLTTGSRHPMQPSIYEEEAREAYWEEFFDGQEVFYGTVQGFKGLERPAIVLCLNGVHEAAPARDRIYTGISRATTLLVVVGPRALLEETGGEAARRRLKDVRPWTVPGDA
ncbi:NERD domain-containing protein [Georgenia sp. Z1344]|uniref:nuclease-related domain-containing DEAD/DEAH box helicase n=1 Tax=Georgenia sp. Z1344 TaxID=3416706 RepID=UPI003CFA391A